MPLSQTFHPFAPPLRDNPHPIFEEARKEEPVFFSEILKCWVVTRYEDVYAVLQDSRRFSSAGNLAVHKESLCPAAKSLLIENQYTDPPLVNEDAPVHTRRRPVYKKLFSQEAIRSLEPRIRDITKELVDGFAHQGHADIVSQLAYPLPMRVVLSWMDIPQEMMETIKRWGDAWVLLLFAELTPEHQMECAHMVVKLQRYIADLLAERLDQKRTDAMTQLATQLLTLEKLSIEELAGMVSGTVVAGNATLTSMVGLTTRVFLQQPNLWQRLREQPERISQAIDEALRLESPFWGLRRVTTEPVEVGGVKLPAGARVLVAFISANRDVERFPQSEVFDLDRPNASQHMSFGKGVHVCVGSGLAKQEVQAAMEVLLQRLPDARLVPGQELTFVPGLLRQHERLLVEWSPQRV
ncbi:cytochrome P450 [Stigmatella aurantiaca]|uniref:Cytochrome P450 family protein n=1 Tax=Stigmatella aurantiaca (strain DW4/3-1) TaxID=378806 RepID=Q090P7_STIAD|nr:cytochrome P450 [Stigmatella aurantiaca]ADO74632.1 Cytochrome P450 family protein [Stigmatella aurantiaca DW4/3-1]EAU66212.1 cytochrome P450 monooxygenase B2 [Stigmatella aurantiaca DW4/3-1]